MKGIYIELKMTGSSSTI